MGDIISSNISELTKEANRLSKLLEIYDKHINSLYKDCLVDISKAWKSSDNKVFIEKLSGYKSDLNDFGKWLKSYIDALNYASKTYEIAKADANRIAASGRG